MLFCYNTFAYTLCFYGIYYDQKHHKKLSSVITSHNHYITWIHYWLVVSWSSSKKVAKKRQSQITRNIACYFAIVYLHRLRFMVSMFRNTTKSCHKSSQVVIILSWIHYWLVVSHLQKRHKKETKSDRHGCYFTIIYLHKLHFMVSMFRNTTKSCPKTS